MSVNLTRDQLVLRLAYLEGELNEEQASCYKKKFAKRNNYDIDVSINVRVNDAEESDCKLIRERVSDHLKDGIRCALLNLTPENREKISDWDIDSQIFTFET